MGIRTLPLQNHPLRQHSLPPRRCRVITWLRQTQNITWTALQLGHMSYTALDKCRKQCDGRCTTADDHNLLALVVQILGPELRMHRLAFEVVRQSRNMREHRLLIAVVPRAQDHPLDPVHDSLLLLTATYIDLHLPSLLLRAPVRTCDLLVVPYALFDVELLHRLPQIRENVVARRNGVARFPWVEFEA